MITGNKRDKAFDVFVETEDTRKPIRYMLTYLWTWPWDIVTWVVVFFIWLFWGTRLVWLEGLWCDLKRNSWPTNTWYRSKIGGRYEINPPELQIQFGRWRTWGGTSLGHGGFYGPGKSGEAGIDTQLESHEHIHQEQWEVAQLVGFMTQLIVIAALLISGVEPIWILHGILWATSSLFAYVCSAFTAKLRGEDPYRGNIYEEGAYSAAKDYAKKQHGLD